MMMMMMTFVNLSKAPNIHRKVMLMVHTEAVSMPNRKQRHKKSEKRKKGRALFWGEGFGGGTPQGH